jgi:hypothetical protein
MGRIGEPKREIHIPVPPVPAPVEQPEPVADPAEPTRPLEPVPAGTP